MACPTFSCPTDSFQDAMMKANAPRGLHAARTGHVLKLFLTAVGKRRGRSSW